MRTREAERIGEPTLAQPNPAAKAHSASMDPSVPMFLFATCCAKRTTIEAVNLETRLKALIVVGVSVLLAGCLDPGSTETVAGTSEEVTNGTIDTMDEAVVALSGPGGGPECTGALITPTIVLTAAHCLAGTVIDHIALGLNARDPEQTVSVEAVYQHPAFDLETLDNDIAVLRLAAPIADMVPLEIALSTAPAVGDSLTVVDFGRATSDLDALTDSTLDARHERRSGRANVLSVEANTVHLTPSPSQPCAGDSGGPIIAAIDGASTIVAITSYGDPGCDSLAVATRVDTFTTFIEPFLPQGGRRQGCSVGPVLPSAAPCWLWVVLALIDAQRRSWSRSARWTGAPKRARCPLGARCPVSRPSPRTARSHVDCADSPSALPEKPTEVEEREQGTAADDCYQQ
jgi:hypothetical protein